MLLDPVSQALLGEIDRQAKQEGEDTLPYWIACPACGKRVVKKALLQKGCYVCGWRGAQDETELARIGRAVPPVAAGPYRTSCPRCHTRVISRHLSEKGCYLCGWRPGAESTSEEKGGDHG